MSDNKLRDLKKTKVQQRQHKQNIAENSEWQNILSLQAWSSTPALRLCNIPIFQVGGQESRDQSTATQKVMDLSPQDFIFCTP